MMVQKEEEGEDPFGIEDLQYYVKRVEEKQFDLDFGVVKQYFPVNVVLSGVLKICQDLYGTIYKMHLLVCFISFRLYFMLDIILRILKNLACCMLYYCITCKQNLSVANSVVPYLNFLPIVFK